MADKPKKTDHDLPAGGDVDAEGAVAIESEEDVQEPRLYNVLLHNDNYTTMEFVVLVLTSIFHHSQAAAMRIMLNVHEKGIGVAGTYPYEVAETKAQKVMQLAREQEYPLRCSVEPVP